MIICMPTLDNNGLDSNLSDHFGSAPYFISVDIPSHNVEALSNGDMDHEHGQCSPIVALQGLQPEAVICRGIGGGAIRKLGSMGVKVMRTTGCTVREALYEFEMGKCRLMSIEEACASHSGCS